MISSVIRLMYKFVSPHFRRGTYLFKDSSISIGSHTSINYPERINIGSNVFIGNFNNIDSSVNIRIGKGTQITNYVSILNHSSHYALIFLKDEYSDYDKQVRLNRQGTVEIGEYTFIGPYTCIMPNSKIGSNCIVKAYSYVEGIFPDNVIIGGNPAIIIKEL